MIASPHRADMETRVRCDSCQRDNPADAAFCSQCGSRLARACPDCGRPYTAREPRSATAAAAGSLTAITTACRTTGRDNPAPPGCEDPPRARPDRRREPHRHGPVHRCRRLRQHRREDRRTRSSTASSAPAPSAWSPPSTATRAPSRSSAAMASWRSSARPSRTRTPPAAPSPPRSRCARALAGVRARAARHRLEGVHLPHRHQHRPRDRRPHRR